MEKNPLKGPIPIDEDDRECPAPARFVSRHDRSDRNVAELSGAGQKRDGTTIEKINIAFISRPLKKRL